MLFIWMCKSTQGAFLKDIPCMLRNEDHNLPPAHREQTLNNHLNGGSHRAIWHIARRSLLILTLLLLVVFFATQALGWAIARRQPTVSASGVVPAGKVAAPEARLNELKASSDGLTRKLAGLAPKGKYVVIDAANNRVFLRNGQQTIREMLASCGTGNVLEDPVSGRTWTFETPRGEFKVLSKKANPIWIKPDWAFIEEGEPIPRNHADRAKPGEMGDYAIGIGDGYYIHGTLYKRLLGRNVSHGCVRLGDEDIKFLFNTVKNGTRVIIY